MSLVSYWWQDPRGDTSSYVENLGDNPITKFFPVEDLPTNINQAEDISTTELDDAVKNLLPQIIKYNSSDSIETAESTTIPVSRYEAFRNVDDLTETASDLYKAAGMFVVDTQITPITICNTEAKRYKYIKGAVVGASLETMTDAIYRVERSMVVWQTKSRHEGEHET